LLIKHACLFGIHLLQFIYDFKGFEVLPKGLGLTNRDMETQDGF
jgi:hypothetical protein